MLLEAHARGMMDTMAIKSCCKVGVLLIGAAVLASCTGSVPSEHGDDTTSSGVSSQAVTASGGASYVDVSAKCRLLLPSTDYQVKAKHFSPLLPASKIRHRIVITPAGDKLLARIDLWDNPRGLSANQWANKHLAYLLDEPATVTSMSFGDKNLDGLLVVRPRSPQSFASRTAIMTDGHRVAVIDGSDVDQGMRREAFDGLVRSFVLEVSP